MLLGAFSPLLSGPVKQPPQSRLPFQLGHVFSASCPACASPKPSSSRGSWSCTEVDVSLVFSVLFLPPPEHLVLLRVQEEGQGNPGSLCMQCCLFSVH